MLASERDFPLILRQACPERLSSFDKLRTNGVEGLRTNGKSVKSFPEITLGHFSEKSRTRHTGRAGWKKQGG